MLGQVLEHVDKGLLIPVLLIFAGAWGISRLSIIHDAKRRTRMEFLELWTDADGMDDLRLEVVTRHLVGTYLPADLIRLLIKQKYPSQSLLDLSDIWSKLEVDPGSRQLRWKSKLNRRSGSRRLLRVFAYLGYFVLALFAVLSFAYVWKHPDGASTWLWGINTLGALVGAFGCLAYIGSLDTVINAGDDLVTRINTALPKPTMPQPMKSR